ncbi:MAG: Do family serine endopeptidase [Maricaulaceae bacterium]|nr:Do family serine endopeptidase [Maricaulaceae bacterium]
MRVLIAAAMLIAVAASPVLAQPQRAPAGFAELNERLSPAVVNIAAAQRLGRSERLPSFPQGSPLERFNELFGDSPRIANSLGSGFIIEANGVVVTNNHVIDGADEVEVTLQDGRVFPAEIVGRDAATDIAVLRIASPDPLPFVSFGDSDAARVGEWVIAIGNPFGLGGSLTAGVISARGREIGGRFDDYIQTDVAINQGNSGGPLFNMDGRVIGVNTAIYSPTGANVGISFAAPSSIVRPVVAQLLEFGETRRGWLGVSVQPVTAALAGGYGLDAPRGAIVSRIEAGGPGEQAGLRPGDLILRFDGRAVPDSRSLPRMVAETQIGRRVRVEILRRGEPMTLNATVARLTETPSSTQTRGGAREPAQPSPQPSGGVTVFGLTLAPLDDAARRRWRVHADARGVLVTAVDPQSDAAGKIRPGDVIEEIAWTPVETPQDARRLAQEASGPSRAAVLFVLNRGGQFVLQTIRP